MELTQIRYDEKKGLATLTISRPSALNALNRQFFYEFNFLLDTIEKNNAIRVVIITGEGKAFVAGADIAEMISMGEKEGYDFSKVGQNTFSRLEKINPVFIAAVNGFALGGGCELAMACDFRIASTKAKFGMPEVGLGLIPGYGGTQMLARLIGTGNAMFLTLTGQMVDASEAYRIGLVQKLTEPDDLLTETEEIANKILSQGPNAVQAVKKVIRDGIQTSIEKGLNIETDWFSKQFTGDGIEGMKAFLEKRKPEWQ
jgi:enoyl-CoA hydratase